MNWYDKLVNLLTGIDAFLRSVSTLTKAGFKIFAPLAIISVVYVALLGLSDDLISRLDTAITNVNLDGLAEGLNAVNTFFPLNEALAMLTSLLGLKVIAAAIRTIKSFIPGWA